MPATRQPLFLARASYRKRRLRDGARVLPIFGTVLVLLPLMWPAVPQMVLAHWAFVFALWVLLILLAAILARDLGDSETASSPEMASAPMQGAGAAANQLSSLALDTPRSLQKSP
jgi:hypothetical protein